MFLKEALTMRFLDGHSMHVILRFVDDLIGSINKRHGEEEEELNPESKPFVLFNETEDFLLTISVTGLRDQVLRYIAGNHGKGEGGYGSRPGYPLPSRAP